MWFKCGEKWGKDHKCKIGHVFLLVDDNEDEVHRVVESEDEEEAELSFHPMTGAHTPSTFQLMGWIGGHEVDLLVDMSSLHNFISSNTIK